MGAARAHQPRARLGVALRLRRPTSRRSTPAGSPHHLIGDDSEPVTVKSSSAWTVNHLYSETYHRGRVFCAGDAVHRHPPSNGLGSNTSIQDAYNLAWKLKLVLDGTTGPELLETYSAERARVGRQIVDRANRSIGETSRIFDALGLLSAGDPGRLRRNMAARKLPTAEAEKQRRALREAIEFKNYEFNTHGVELNQRYASSRVVPDGTQMPVNPRDDELYHFAATWPAPSCRTPGWAGTAPGCPPWTSAGGAGSPCSPG